MENCCYRTIEPVRLAMCQVALKMTNRPVSPSSGVFASSRGNHAMWVLENGASLSYSYSREGRDIAHLYDYFMVRPVTHTHTRAGRQWLEALHHARSRRFPVYNPAGLCTCARFRVESTAAPVPVERVRACTEDWVDVAARVFYAHRSHGSRAPR